MTSKYLTLQITPPTSQKLETINNSNIKSANIVQSPNVKVTDVKVTAQSQKEYMIISWNVDGYTSDIHWWLLSFTERSRPDIIFLSETKKNVHELAGLMNAFTDYNVIINSHNPAKWHGVAMLIRKDHSYEQLPVQMNIPVRKDSNGTEAATGRIILIHLNKQIYIIGSYTPNSGRNDTIKLDYRTKTWDPVFMHILEMLRQAGPTIWIGDINAALDTIDVSNPKTMSQYAGFTLEERANLRSLLSTGEWIDIWRHQHPTDRMYSWCGCPPQLNYGMRLDNIIISKLLLPDMVNSFMITECPISADHIPIGATIRIDGL